MSLTLIEMSRKRNQISFDRTYSSKWQFIVIVVQPDDSTKTFRKIADDIVVFPETSCHILLILQANKCEPHASQTPNHPIDAYESDKLDWSNIPTQCAVHTWQIRRR